MEKSFITFNLRVEKVKEIFSCCTTPEDKYKKIIELGTILPALPQKDLIKENLVHGCQSELFVITYLEHDLFYFTAHSDALISKGLAALLYKVYNGLSPQEVLQTPPVFLQELGISTSLSPSRANGLSSLYLSLQKSALKFLLQLASK